MQCISVDGVGGAETLSCKEGRLNPGALVVRGKQATPLAMPSTREYTAKALKQLVVETSFAPPLPAVVTTRKRDTVAANAWYRNAVVRV